MTYPTMRDMGTRTGREQKILFLFMLQIQRIIYVLFETFKHMLQTKWFVSLNRQTVRYSPLLRIRIRDPVPYGPLDPGWLKSQDPDPG